MTETATATVYPRVPATMPWSLYTVFCAMISAYWMVPLIFNSAIALLLPLVPIGPRSLATELSVLVGWGVVFWLLHRACQKSNAGCSLTAILGLTHERPWYYYVLESMIAMLAASTLVYAISAFKEVSGLSAPNSAEDVSAGELGALAIVAVGVAPILEEFVFRGYWQTALTQYFGSPWRAILITSMMFMLCHNTYMNSALALMYVLCLGLLLGYFRYRTGSVIPCIVAHLANNSVAMQGILNNFLDGNK